MEPKYSRRALAARPSDVREMLKAAEDPEMISFAGGLPAAELFPVDAVAEASRAVLAEAGAKALQYSSTEGYAPLRQWISARMAMTIGAGFDADSIQIVHGSQQALDLAGKVFLDEGDQVLVERPTYLAALSAFRMYGANFVCVDTDEEGMLPEALEAALKESRRAKLIYIVPDFQNPTGRTWSAARRRRLAELSQQYGVMVFEDNPYTELRFEGTPIASTASFGGDNVLVTGTFSKTFCPGYRIGWVAGNQDVIRKFTLLKQSSDLQCNTLAQMEIFKYLDTNDIDAHIARIRTVYRGRRDLMLAGIAQYLPQSVRMNRPMGGLFAWGELPAHLDARAVVAECIKEKVMFVPGDSFYPDGEVHNTFRINFSAMPEPRITEGIQRMGTVLRRLV